MRPAPSCLSPSTGTWTSRIGGAECEGLALGSTELVFRPGQVRAGDYHFAIGTAGSTGLVLQTVLMPLLLADGPSRLVIEGGTHAMAAPPFEFIERVFLPVLNLMGPRVEARLVRHGFFPKGGGRIEVDIHPAPLAAIDCIDRGARRAAKAALKYPAVRFDEDQRCLIGEGFEQAVREGRYDLHALCIGHDHAHAVVARHERDIKRIAGHLKSKATMALTRAGLHPLRAFRTPAGVIPSPWSEGVWSVFINDDPQLSAAIEYVRRHPMKQGLPPPRAIGS